MGYTPENNPYIPGDPYSYDLKWLVNKIKETDGNLEILKEQFTTPMAVHYAAEFTDKNKIYVYVGSEAGYTYGHWYYFDTGTNLWTDGGAFGAYSMDSAFSATSVNGLENRVITNALGWGGSLKTSGRDSIVDAINSIISDPTRIITLADSYGGKPTAATSWQAYLHNYYPDAVFYDFWEGSAGIYHIGSNGHNAETLLSSNASSIPTHSTISDIVIAMGINDYNDTLSYVDAAYDSLISYIKSEFPNARVHFAFQGNNTTLSGTNRAKVVNCVKLQQEKCTANNCVFMDGIQYIMHNLYNVDSDNVHPTLAGSQAIAKGIACAMRTGHYDYVYNEFPAVQLTGGTASICDYWIDGPISQIHLPDLATTQSFSFAAGTWVKIGEITDPVLVWGMAVCTAQVYAGTPPDTTPTLLINRGNIYLKFIKATTLGSGFQLNNISLVSPTMTA